MHLTIAVRDSSLADLPHIDRIRSHPLVRPHQFQISSNCVSSWEKWIELNARSGDFWFRCSTIVDDEQVIGYISQTLNFTRTCVFAECGWNLHPTYWGRGIMKLALGQILLRLFNEQKMSYVIADCFRSNTRCKRLLSNLHFSRVNVRWIERMRLAIDYRCLHWIERYRIDHGTWNAKYLRTQARWRSNTAVILRP
jgi:RimJ/RimL family protein N-acetyltransferase